MKLKKLELYGFKSFADKTAFEFEDSLSALVGPNGSGKSNVVDAIKWVLGERSAQKLRGSEMASVIFNGSDGRKALNYAEAKLSIDNADRWLPVEYDEVCICRRVDRTGQSVMFLNGRPCRLKDVRQLLMDTGIGTGCYSLIEQGQIDRILRSSPKERRGIFEEAAGINRFLDQKREAEQKLERVTANLARIGDILEEVQRQLRSVKYQAGRARTFKQQSERLQRLRLAHGLHTYRDLTRRKREHAAEIESAAREKTGLDQQQAAVEADAESARTELQRAQNELADARQRLTRIEGRLDALGRESELNRKRSEELEHQLGGIAQRRDVLEERARLLASEIEAASAKLEQSAWQVAEKSEQSKEVRRRIEDVRAHSKQGEEELEAGKAAVFDLFQRESQLNNQTQVVAAEKRALLHRLERVENRARELAEQQRGMEDERSRTHERLEALNAEQAGLNRQMEDVRHALAEARARAEDIGSRESETRAELSGKLARLELIEDLEARAEGVRSGARRLLEADLPGTVGLVASALDVPLELAPAVEAALGDRVQAVIVEGPAQAREALRLLACDHAGRAELIVLECLVAPERVESPARPGVRGRLSELIGCNDRAAKAARFLLANTFLVEDRDAAEAILAAGLPQGARLVTPTGECYGGDGIWSGGEPETPSLISRRSEVAELRSQLDGLRQVLSELAERRQNVLAKIGELDGEKASLATRAEDLKRSAADVRSHLHVVTSRADETRQELQLAAAEGAAIARDIETVEAHTAQLKAQVQQALRDRSAAQRAVEDQQQRLRETQQQGQRLADEANTLGAELAGAREQHRGAEALLERLHADRQSRESELAGLVGEQEACVRRRAETQRALESARAERRSLAKDRDDLRKMLDTRSSAVDELQQEIVRLIERSRQVAKQREVLDERLHGMRIAESETSVKIQDLLERMAEDCGVRLQRLELAPERWRDESPFTTKLIREFCDKVAEPPPMEPIAAWYSELQKPSDPEQEQQDEGPEMVSLQEAGQLREAVLELADDTGTDWARTKAKIASLKAKVDRIGNVNVAAIREQETLETRLQFLTDQKEDLEKARRHEREIIRELSKKSRERFWETFEQVRENFRSLFRKLFGGGAADLVLDDEEEDILEAGINLIARPPGKQTTAITLLSGGERALTTIALLFAMFQAKPSPFCLLDEVDAPLDDANVERFLMLLREFSQDTQFVIITHNKQTMSIAQVLYGLTMTDGVSRKISVKFDEVERHLNARPAPRAKAG